MNKKVTIQDIADALGVSRNTVSKAINSSEGLADATREKILQKALEMGYKQFSYVASISAMNAAKNDSHSQNAGEIALMVGNFLGMNHFASLMMDKFQIEAAEMGYTISTYRVTKKNLREKTFPKTLDMDRICAIVCVEIFDYDYGVFICSAGLPVLFVDGPCACGEEPLQGDFLLMDNTSEITRFVKMMINRGFRKIGFIGDVYHCQSFYERYMAYRMGMIMEGVDVDKKFLILTKDRDKDAMQEALENMDELPDAFVCANDFVAIAAMQIYAARDRSILQKVRFLGFDDSHDSRIFYPSLSTIHIHTQAMSFSALHLLMTRIKEPSLDYRKIYVATNLILRDSTEF